MTYEEAIALVRRWPTMIGVAWTGGDPRRGRAIYDDGPAPPLLEALAACRVCSTRLSKRADPTCVGGLWKVTLPAGASRGTA